MRTYEAVRDWKSKNPEKVREQHRRYRANNPDKIAVWRKQHKKKNREKYYGYEKKRRQKMFDWVQGYKQEIGCIFCGLNEPWCLDFHHIDANEKEYTVSRLIRQSRSKFLAEIEKCVVVCANCHRRIIH